MLDPQITQWAVLAMIALAVGGVAFVFLAPLFADDRRASKRIQEVAHQKEVRSAKQKANESANRRRVVQDTLKELEEKKKNAKKRLTLRAMIEQAGLSLSIQAFVIISFFSGVLTAIGAFVVAGASPLVAVGAGLVGGLGLPRWVILFMRRRRMKKFLEDFPNAIDIIVRGVKTGLPLNDTIRIIASESPEPVRSEFREIVEAQTLGLPVADGLARMFDRVPLPEVNFLTIVIEIQSQAGGNLSEALGNLSRVLRERKRLRGKIQAMSQEAKSSAAIIGALPLVVMGGLYVTTPEYLNELFYHPTGHILLGISVTWMTIGILVMRKMINFDI